MDCYFTYQSATCYYFTEGEGMPLLLLHGFAEDGTIWKNQINFLQKHCKLIIPDLPGSGRSAFIHYSLKTISIEDYAAYIFAVLEHAGIKKCIMLGHSMGGYIAVAFAEKHPELLYGFGFVHSTAFADNEEKKLVRKKAIETIAEYGAAAFIRNTTPNIFAAAYKFTHADEIEALIEKGKQFSVETLQQYYAAMMNRKDRADVLTKSAVPVLFMIGMHDVAVPPADALTQCHLADESHIYILSQAGHMGMWEAADTVNNAILNFIGCIAKNYIELK